MNFCCDCRISEGINQERTIWYVNERGLSNKQQYFPELSNPQSEPSKLQNNASHVTLPKAKMNLSHFRTGTASTVDLSVRDKSELAGESGSSGERKRISQLRRQNSEYIQIIQTQLKPLKREYQSLLQQFKGKSALIEIMNDRLREVELSRQAQGSLQPRFRKPQA